MTWTLVVVIFSALLVEPSIRFIAYPDRDSCEQAAADVAALHQSADRTISAYCTAAEHRT